MLYVWTAASDVKHSTLEDLDDQDIFKSFIEPSSDKFNDHEISKTGLRPNCDARHKESIEVSVKSQTGKGGLVFLLVLVYM